MFADFSLVQCTCTIITIHTVRSCEWKAIMTIYDEMIEKREDGMNSTSLVFVNMISSSFLIQPIMNETCLQWQLEIIVAHAMLNLLGVYNGLPGVLTCYWNGFMWYDRVVSSFEWFKWLDMAHVHTCSWNKINIASTIFMIMVIYILLMLALIVD